MNRTEHLLICLAEEAAEVSHRVSKALRFGLTEIQEGQPLTNAQRICQEFHDMLAIVELLEESGALERSPDTNAIERKKAKVLGWMQYAEQCGTLGEPPHGWKQTAHTLQTMIDWMRESRALFPQCSDEYDDSITALTTSLGHVQFFDSRRKFPELDGGAK